MSRNLPRRVVVGVAVVVSFLTSPVAPGQVAAIPRMNQWGECQGYFDSIGGYYGVGVDQVGVVRQMGVSEDEIPVVFFISTRSRVSPEQVARLRLSGRPWVDISRQYGIGPEAYYVPMGDMGGGTLPNGRLLGYYRYPREQWGTLQFADEDLVRLANVQLLSARYGVPATDVLRASYGGSRYYMLDRQYRGGPPTAPDKPKKKYAFQE